MMQLFGAPWDGEYDSIPEDGKLLVQIAYELGVEDAQRKILGFSAKDADLFAAALRRKLKALP